MKTFYLSIFFLLVTPWMLSGAPSDPGSEVEVESEPSSQPIRQAREATALILFILPTPQPGAKGLTVTIEGKRYPVLSQQTGVVIGSTGTILTVAHGIKEGSRPVVFAFDGQKWRPFPSEWVRQDRTVDLALIKLNTKGVSLRDVRLHADTPGEGEEVFFWGYLRLGRTFRPFYRKGAVSALGKGGAPGDPSPKVVFFEAISVGGSSGSPLLNGTGELVGIVSGQLEKYLSLGKEETVTRQPVGISYGIAVETIRKFLGAQGILTP